MPRQSTRGTGRGRRGSGDGNAPPPAPPAPPDSADGAGPSDGGAVEPIEIQEEMERSFLEYSMSVIVARALPDVRDGLKPVHRRILYAMFDNGLRPDRPHNKCAKVVGEVMGTLPPPRRLRHLRRAGSHGPGLLAPLPADRRTRQLRVPRPGRRAGRHALHRVPARAARRWNCSADIDEETVDMIANYDGSALEPVVLPSRFPNLLVNGSPGNRGRHGDEHPAPQPGGGRRRRHSRARSPRGDTGRAHGVREGPRLPDRRAHPRAPGDPRRVPDGPRLDQDARGRGDRGRSGRRPHRGHRDPLSDLRRGDRAEDQRPGQVRGARRHQRDAQRPRPSNSPVS